MRNNCMLFLLVVFCLGCGSGTNSTNSNPTISDSRTYWKHLTGHFAKMPDGTWTEAAPDGTHSFVESSRTEKAVELTDKARNIIVTLYAGDATAKVAGGNPVPLYEGNWEPKPAVITPGKVTGDWVSDTPFTKQLAAEFDVNGYRIRPPNWGEPEQKTQGGTKSYSWTGPKRNDGSVPRILVLVGNLAVAEQTKPLEEAMAVLRPKLLAYRESSSERGKLGELTWARVSFEGAEMAGGDPVLFKGIAYHTHDGDKYIHIKLMDRNEKFSESMGLLEAAVRTLRKP